MGRVLTNNASFAYNIEASLGTAGSNWFQLEPNAISAFGADISTVARSPISRNRQRRKGVITDLDSSVEMEADITLSAFRDFIEGFMFVTGINTDVTGLAVTAATDGGGSEDGFTVSAIDADQAGKFEVDTLVWVSGMETDANNGLFALATDAANTDTTLEVATGTLTAETGQTGRLSFAGHRIAAADTVTWTWASGTSEATLALTGVGTLLGTLGLTAGMVVHVGSIASVGGAIQNAFENSAANDMFGYARVKSITADAVVFDKVDAALQFTDSTDPATAVDILFGEFFRNVATSASDYLERSFHFEAEWANLGAAGASEFEYAKGNYCNTIAFNLPLTNKATVSFGFIGTDTEPPVAAGSRKAGAASASAPDQTAAFNTSADIARLRITDTDESGLTTDFKSLTLTLNNNVSPEKILGTLGAAYMNTGNFEVDIEAQMLFTNGDVVDRIRDNTTVTMDFILKGDDGIIAVDIPSATLGGGGRELPVNESVLLNTTVQAFQDATLDTSLGITIIPVPLP